MQEVSKIGAGLNCVLRGFFIHKTNYNNNYDRIIRQRTRRIN